MSLLNAKKIVIALCVALVMVCSVCFAETNNTPDYEWWGDSQFGTRHTIGYDDIYADPETYGLKTSTPELGDSSVTISATAGMCAVAFVGVIAADKKRRSLNH